MIDIDKLYEDIGAVKELKDLLDLIDVDSSSCSISACGCANRQHLLPASIYVELAKYPELRETIRNDIQAYLDKLKQNLNQTYREET